MIGVAEDEKKISFSGKEGGLLLGVFDEGARGVGDPAAAALLKLLLHTGRDAVGPDEHAGAFRHIFDALGHHESFSAQPFDFLGIVDGHADGVDFPVPLSCGGAFVDAFFKALDGPFHPEAEPRGRSDLNDDFPLLPFQDASGPPFLSVQTSPASG